MPSTRLYGPSIATPSPASGVPAINVQAQSGVIPLPATLTTGTSTAEALIPNPATPTKPLLVQVPASSGLEQRVWEFEGSGYIVTGGTTNVTLKTYAALGTATLSTSSTALGSSGAVAQNSAKAPFWIHGKAIYDSISGKLTGTIDYLINNTVVASAAFGAVLTGISDTANPVLSLGFSITCSAGFATNEIVVQDWCIKF
jgi:hypothetical protein